MKFLSNLLNEIKQSGFEKIAAIFSSSSTKLLTKDI